MNQHCIDCRYCWKDDRSTVYRRPPMYFCKKKGGFFSRSYKIGVGNRIDPEAPSCEKFSPKEL